MKVAVTKITPVATLAMYHAVSTYDQLKKAVIDFDCETRAFHAGSSSKTVNELVSAKYWETDVKLLVRPDARVRNVKVKKEKVANQT